MENTCVLHFLPVIPNWKVFNLPQIKHIEYFSILKRKREFQCLLEKALAIKKYLKTGSCSIISRQFHFSVNEKNIDIVFLSDINLLSLTLRIQERCVLKRRNNILVFLKSISNDITYEIKNDNIYTRCEESIKWKIFYSLFEFLLLRYGTSIIGAIFYNYLALRYMLMNERMFLGQLTVEYINPLNSNSWCNQKSCDYSVTETLINFDKNQKAFAFNSVQFNKPSCVLLPSQDFISNISNLSVKRKATDDISSCCKLPKQEFSSETKCLYFEKECKCHTTKWKVLRSIKTCNINSYMDILLRKGVLCDTEFSDSLKSNGFECSQEPLSIENFSFTSHQTDKNDKCNIISGKQILENSVKLADSNEFQNEVQSTEKDIILKEKVLDIKIDEVVNEQTGGYNLQTKALKNTNFGNVSKKDISSLFSEFMDEEVSGDNGTFSMFKTAAGKKVNISETALKSVEKMFGDVFHSEEASDFEMKTFVKASTKSDFKNRLNTPAYKPSHFSRKSNIKVEVQETIDGVLAEKFFEEISFDDKEVDNCSENLCSPSLPSTFASNVSERMVTCGKVRKSLGGRRSLKPYSVPNA